MFSAKSHLQYLLFLFLVSFNNSIFAAPSFTEKDITQVGWEVIFLSSYYDSETDTTTFTYSLTVDNLEKDLSHWVLALDEMPLSSEGCADVKFGLDPTTGVYGWKCDDGQNKGTTQHYTLVFSGNLGEADTSYSVKGGTYFAVGNTTGPGNTIIDQVKYSIDGIVFIDANFNAMHDADEPLLGNVLVTLSDGQSIQTDAVGHYSFANLSAGIYTVNLPEITPTILNDFNETLSSYFTATTPVSIGTVIGPDSTGNDFGFAVNTAAIIDDLNPGDPDGDGILLAGTGKTIGFWKHQLTSALKGKTKGIQVSAASLTDYLYGTTTSVQNLYIDIFADIPNTNLAAYSYALNILSSTSSDAVDLLKKQLMGTELNHLAGIGLDNSHLQGALIAWSEFLVKNSVIFSRAQLLEAKDICDLINNSGE